jgi:hypothetical protein
MFAPKFLILAALALFSTGATASVIENRCLGGGAACVGASQSCCANYLCSPGACLLLLFRALLLTGMIHSHQPVCACAVNFDSQADEMAWGRCCLEACVALYHSTSPPSMELLHSPSLSSCSSQPSNGCHVSAWAGLNDSITSCRRIILAKQALIWPHQGLPVELVWGR